MLGAMRFSKLFIFSQSKILRFFLISSGLFLSLSSWALSSPVSSSPDDDFHLGSIWCANGFVDGVCQAYGEINMGGRTQVEISSIGSPCFAGNPTLTAACQESQFKVPLQGAYANTGLYPSGFYKFQSNFVLDRGALSVVLMRTVNSLIFTALFLLAIASTASKNKLPVALVFLLSSIPMGMFVIPSTNPSSWFYIAILLNWSYQVNLVTNSRTRIRAFTSGVGMLLTGIMALESRQDGKYFIIFSILVTYLLIWNSYGIKKSWVHAVPLSLFALSLLRFLSSNSFQGFGPSGSGVEINFASYVVTSLLRSIEIPLGNLGLLPPGASIGILGWLDTPIPNLVPLITIGLFVGWLFLLTKNDGVAKNIAYFFTLLVLFGLPFYYLFIGRNLVGEYVQPRYLIGTLPIFLIASIGLKRNYSLEFNAVISNRLLISALLLSVANSLSLYSNLKRYTHGFQDQQMINLDSSVNWWWPIPITPNFVLIIGSLSFLIFVLALVSYVNSNNKTLVK